MKRRIQIRVEVGDERGQLFNDEISEYIDREVQRFMAHLRHGLLIYGVGGRMPSNKVSVEKEVADVARS